MDKDMEKLSQPRIKKMKRQRVWLTVVAALALVVLGFSAFKLIRPASAATTDLKSYITGVEDTSGNITYDSTTKTFNGLSYKLNFTIPKEKLVNEDTSDTQHIFVYQYPKGVIVPPDLLTDSDGNTVVMDLRDDSETKVGTYYFTQDGSQTYSVNLSFDDDYANNAGDTVSGYVTFSGSYGYDKEITSEEIVIKFTDECTITVQPDKIKYSYDLKAKKSATLSTDCSSITYSVYVCSQNGTADVVNLTDIVSADSAITITENPTVTVNTATFNAYSSDFTLKTKGSEIAVQYTADTTNMAMTLPKISAGVSKVDSNGTSYVLANGYVITYSYKISTKDHVSAGITNKVTVTSGDSDHGTYVYDEKSVTTWVQWSNEIWKSCDYNTSTSASWTIHVESRNKHSISGYVVTDDMFSNVKAADVIVSPADGGYVVNTDSNGYITNITFNNQPGKDGNYGTYSIKYSTQGNYTNSVNNKVTVIPPDGDPYYGYASTSTGTSTVETGKITKTGSFVAATGSEDNKMSWNVLIPMDIGIPANSKLTDSLDAWNVYQYYSAEDCAAIGDLLTQTFGSGNVTITFSTNGNSANGSNTWKNYTYTNANDFTSQCEGLHFNQFTCIFNKSIPKASAPLSLSYSSTADISSAQAKNHFTNTIGISGNSLSLKGSYSYEFFGATFKKTDGNGQTSQTATSNSDGTLTWKVTASVDRAQDYDNVVITDSLPEGIALSSMDISVGWRGHSGITLAKNSNTAEGNVNDVTYEDSGNYHYLISVSGQDVTTTISMTNGQALTAYDNDVITITYHCKVVPSQLDGYIRGESYSFSNHAIMKMGEKTFEATQIQEWHDDYKIIDKTGKFDKNNQKVSYTVLLNPDAVKFADLDTLTFTDVLTYSADEGTVNRYASLDQASVKLYLITEDNPSGTLLSSNQWSWEFNEAYSNGSYTDTINAVVPNGASLKLTYDYLISGNFSDSDNVNVGLFNTASISGIKSTSEDDLRSIKWYKSSSDGKVSTDHSYTFVKVTSGNYSATIADAQFTVYDASGDTPTAVKTYKSNTNGKFTIAFKDGVYESGKLYYVTETKAPDGYVIPTDAPKYYFYFTEDGESYTPDASLNAVNLTKRSATAYVPNDESPFSLSITKKWIDSEENEITDNESINCEEITVYIHQMDYVENEQCGDIVFGNKSYTIDASNNWTLTVTDLPKRSYETKSDGTIVTHNYKYYVEELSVNGYELVSYTTQVGDEEYVVDSSNPLTGGSVVITNKEISYRLPETGGPGQLGWTKYVGICLAAFAIFGICILLTRKNIRKGEQK